MGTFNLAIQYPDGQQARILAALRAHYTTRDAEGNPVVPTANQAIERYRQSQAAALRDLVVRTDRDAAAAAAVAAVTEPGIT